MGLPAVLASRTRLLGPDCEPLLVLGPRPLRRALQGYAQLEPMRFRFLEASATAGPPPPGAPQPPEPSPEARAAIDGALAALGLTRLESVLVAHCAHAYGLVLERGEGVEGGRGPWKLVFSGDTRPCPQLVEAARGATLLIHEVRRRVWRGVAWRSAAFGWQACGLASRGAAVLRPGRLSWCQL